MGLSKREAYTLMFSEYPDVVNIVQLCEILGGISTKTGYQLLRENKIKHYRIGREYRIPKIHIFTYLDII